MASFDPIDPFDPHADEPPPRPTTPPVRLGFLIVLGGLLLAAALVYGIPYVAFRTGYAYEAGRARAASEMLAKMDEAGVINKASALFRAASTAVAPAVVNIQCLRDVNLAHQGIKLPPGAPERGLFPVSAGSGVVIDKARGFIVTNGHVVEGADEISIRLGQGAEYPAKLVGADSKTDLAVLKVDASLDVEARWGDVSKLDIGDWVLAIGSPFQLERSVTVGIVSAIGRRNLRIVGDGGGYEDFIQTDAAINPGNSGGPLIDLRGQIVGINTAIYSPQNGADFEGRGGNIGIGFAISAELAQNVVEQIIEKGRVSRGYLGVTLSDLNPAIARKLGLPTAQGAVVVEVDPDSPAAEGGLKSGDVIVGLNNQPVADLADLRNRTATLPVGTEVPLTYYRKGQKNRLAVKIAELPTLRSMGMRLQEIPPQGPEGKPALVVDQVLPGSPAHRAGVREGMRILAIGNRKVGSRDEAESVAGRLNPTEGIPLHVQTPAGPAEIVLGRPRKR